MKVKLVKQLDKTMYFEAKKLKDDLENYITIAELELHTTKSDIKELRGRPMIRCVFTINNYQKGKSLDGIEESLSKALDKYYD